MNRPAKKRLISVALDCLRDLAIALVYAIFAGGLIVAVVASDTSQLSVLHAAFYAAILPCIVLAMIGFEVVASVLAEWRSAYRSLEPTRKTLPFGCASSE